MDKALQIFNDLFYQNEQVQQRLNVPIQEVVKKEKMQVKINQIEFKIFRQNSFIFEKIGIQSFWEHFMYAYL